MSDTPKRLALIRDHALVKLPRGLNRLRAQWQAASRLLPRVSRRPTLQPR